MWYVATGNFIHYAYLDCSDSVFVIIIKHCFICFYPICCILKSYIVCCFIVEVHCFKYYFKWIHNKNIHKFYTIFKHVRSDCLNTKMSWFISYVLILSYDLYLHVNFPAWWCVHTTAKLQNETSNPLTYNSSNVYSSLTVKSLFFFTFKITQKLAFGCERYQQKVFFLSVCCF